MYRVVEQENALIVVTHANWSSRWILISGCSSWAGGLRASARCRSRQGRAFRVKSTPFVTVPLSDTFNGVVLGWETTIVGSNRTGAMMKMNSIKCGEINYGSLEWGDLPGLNVRQLGRGTSMQKKSHCEHIPWHRFLCWTKRVVNKTSLLTPEDSLNKS